MCKHKKITRPTSLRKGDAPYVRCLDCAFKAKVEVTKTEMKIVKPWWKERAS